ncbi:uncharacterized protein [Diadema setosum]|uniref:uncharacterized protein n=1 Tax=Diadema setosum TaxID=31175 RepID=UPI003B3B7C1F
MRLVLHQALWIGLLMIGSPISRTVQPSTACLTPYCPNDCLIAYYPFEDDLTDSSGNDHDGVNGGSQQVTYFSAGKCGKAASFSGSSKVTVDSLRNYAWGTQFSVSVWFRRTGQWGNYQGIVNNGYHTGGSWEIRMGRENSGQMLGGGIVTPTSSRTWDYSHLVAAQNTWNHVVMTYDGSTLWYYLNGQAQTPLTRVGPILIRNSPVTIGQAGPPMAGEFFYGLIDEVKIFGRQLSATEVFNMYEHPCL